MFKYTNYKYLSTTLRRYLIGPMIRMIESIKRYHESQKQNTSLLLFYQCQWAGNIENRKQNKNAEKELGKKNQNGFERKMQKFTR